MIHMRYMPLSLAIFSLGFWLLLSALTNLGQFGDNFEQFNWAHSAEWGYWKHPPLTTWLLVGFQSIAGVHVGNAYAMSFVCLSLTLYFVWKTAQEVLPNCWAGLCVLLLSTTQMWTWRAQLYNHNVTLVMMVSMCTYLTVHLLKSEMPSLWKWACLGGLAGLSILTKYQAAVPLAGLLILVVFYGFGQGKKIWIGLGVAFLCFVLMLIPHVIWMYQTNFLIFKYATHTISGGPWLDRSINLLSFSVQQLKYVGVMLLTLLLMKATKVWGSNDSSHISVTDKELTHSYPMFMHLMWALLLFPALIFGLLNQAAGVRLQNHWGMQLLLFLPLLLVGRTYQKSAQLNIRLMLGVYVFAQVLNLSFYVSTMHPAKPGDVDYPAQTIADYVVQTWREQTACPLTFISGPPFEAGMTSVYSGNYPNVIEKGDLSKSPWVDIQMLKKHGFVDMSHESLDVQDSAKVHRLPEDVIIDFPRLQTLRWTNVLPEQACPRLSYFQLPTHQG